MSSAASRTEHDLREAVRGHRATVAVIGLGTIGLPLATFAGARGFNVVGLDVDPKRVADVNARSVLFEYTEILQDIPADRLRATTDAKDLANADVLFFCVPTPVDQAGYIMLDRLEAAANSVGPHLKRGALVVLESSVEIGTTRWFADILGARSDLVPGEGFHVAYCPERYNPGLPNEKHAQVIYGKRVKLAGPLSYHSIPRVVGGATPFSGEIAQLVYSQVIEAPVQLVSAIEVAEAAKLMENIFRDVNIALMNEFTRALSALNVDTYEVIQAAATKTFAFLPHYPGLVGGECIPVDTWYLIRQAERVGVDLKLMRMARTVNDDVVGDVVRLTLDGIRASGRPIAGAKVAILGTAYKANVFDDRVSPSRGIATELRAHGVEVALCDPIVKEHNHRTKDVLVGIDEALAGADVAVLATEHEVFRALAPADVGRHMRARFVVDARNALDHAGYEAAGFHVDVWGRVRG